MSVALVGASLTAAATCEPDMWAAARLGLAREARSEARPRAGSEATSGVKLETRSAIASQGAEQTASESSYGTTAERRFPSVVRARSTGVAYSAYNNNAARAACASQPRTGTAGITIGVVRVSRRRLRISFILGAPRRMSGASQAACCAHRM